MSEKIKLNQMQQEAVDAVEGPLLILAGAGSGKTRVITQRTIHLIEDCGVDPWNILAITFTNKAAREMKERIEGSSEQGSRVLVSTFHSLCLRILYRYADRIGYSSQFEISDASDQKSLIKAICKDFQIDTKQFKEKMLLGNISSAKDELIGPEEYANRAGADFIKKKVASVYQEYQMRLKRNNSFDFDDLIMKTVELFRLFPEVLDGYQERFKYIMVDEYQDTNTAQFELIRLLAGKYRNLCVVGDDDQSIYKFRGANIRNILDFEKYYPDARVVRLEQNYRSTRNILDAANEVISNNVGRKSKSLWTEGEEGSKIHFKQLDNAYYEARYVAEDIKRRVEQEGIKYGDCAILMRTNVQSKEFEDAFRTLRIDYDLVKGLRFWDTKVIKDVTSYLLTVASGSNDLRSVRIINVPKRGIGPGSVEKLQQYAIGQGISFFEACRRAEEVPGLARAAAKVKDFSDMILRIRERMEFLTYGELVEVILEETDYLEYLQDEADNEEKYNEMLDYINKLKDALTEYERTSNEPDIIDFMRQNGVEGNNINTSIEGGVIQKELTPQEERELRERKVLIMTMHNAKGLEFPCVYLVGMEDGLFPSYMTITSEDSMEMEEERRLCYVAITRAKRQLTITCARSRMVNGETRMSKTSRFVKEIPFALLDMQPPKEKPVFSDYISAQPKDAYRPATAGGSYRTFSANNGYGSKAGDRDMASKPRAVAKPRSSSAGLSYMKGMAMPVLKSLDYEVGDRVSHIKFGEGTVIEILPGTRDFEVKVDFDKAGIKRMFAGFAKLKKL